MSGARVLVVDDTAVLRRTLATMLTVAGFEVCGEAGDGDEAVAQAAVLQPDVVLLDLSMPRRAGLDAIAPILGVAPQARIVMLTGFDDPGLAGRARRAGAHGFVVKGAAPDELYDAVRAAVSDRCRPLPSGPDGDGRPSG